MWSFSKLQALFVAIRWIASENSDTELWLFHWSGLKIMKTQSNPFHMYVAVWSISLYRSSQNEKLCLLVLDLKERTHSRLYGEIRWSTPTTYNCNVETYIFLFIYFFHSNRVIRPIFPAKYDRRKVSRQVRSAKSTRSCTCDEKPCVCSPRSPKRKVLFGDLGLEVLDDDYDGGGAPPSPDVDEYESDRETEEGRHERAFVNECIRDWKWK